MLLSAVSVLVVAQSSSEIPEGLMNNPVVFWYYWCTVQPWRMKRCFSLLPHAGSLCSYRVWRRDIRL